MNSHLENTNEMNSLPLLTIIIATKNRQKYALHAVESILAIDDNRIELVIQDNSDANELGALLSKYASDKRLRYRYTPPPFSSIDNFNAGIELSTGEYICLIGDDDGINPEIIEATLWAKNNGVDALVGSLTANYRWAGTGAPDTLFTKMTGGTLTITHFEGKICHPSLEDSLLKFALNGCTNYLDISLPKLYHGVVRREYMEVIKSKTGAYINGLSPDVYSSIALACIVNKLVTVDYPLTIPGVCAESTSITEGQIRKHSNRLEDAPHFRDRGPYTWSIEVPRIYCVETIWADSGFAALKDMNRFDLVQRFNRHKLYAYILTANHAVGGKIFDHMLTISGRLTTKLLIDIILVFPSLLSGPFQKFLLKRCLGRLMILIGKRRLETLVNLPDIYEAMKTLETYLKENNFLISSVLSKNKTTLIVK